VQVDVSEPAAGHFLLVVLEHGGVRRRLAVENDVEDRVRAALAGECAPQVALGNAKRVRRLAAPVEHARDEALLAQAPGVGGAAALARLHLELHPFPGHVGGEV
jgi:hypothetical protein